MENKGKSTLVHDTICLFVITLVAGILLGGAIGNERAYIDLLIYDEKTFEQKLRCLAGCGEEFSLGEFKRHSPLRPLAF